MESDNLEGSTDSEVRKILTLHIPITEYDTLGSESDNELSAKSIKQAKYKSQRGKIFTFFNIKLYVIHNFFNFNQIPTKKPPPLPKTPHRTSPGNTSNLIQPANRPNHRRI